MFDVMKLPEQFVLINEKYTRDDLEAQVEAVGRLYSHGDRRSSIHTLLSSFYDDFQAQASHVLGDILGIKVPGVFPPGDGSHELQTEHKEGNTGTTLEFAEETEPNEIDIETTREFLQSTRRPRDLPQQAFPQLSKLPQPAASVMDGRISGAIVEILSAVLLVGIIVVLAVRRQRAAKTGVAPPFTVESGRGRRCTKNKNDLYAPPAEKRLPELASDVVVAAKNPENDAQNTTAAIASTSTGNGNTIGKSSRLVLAGDFAVWVSLAIGFSAYGKGYLRDTRDPVGLLVLQGATGVVVLGALGFFGTLDLNPRKELRSVVSGRAGGAGILHTSQALLTNVAVLVGGVAVTNAVKAMEPVAAAVFSYLLLGKKCSRIRVLAIVTIVTGIILLTSKHCGGGGGCDGGGGGGGSAVLTSSFVTIAAVCCNALRNVVLKSGTPIPSHVTLYVCSVAATFVGLTIMLSRLVLELIVGSEAAAVVRAETTASAHSGWLQPSGVHAALCFVGYNFASFNLLAYMSPVGHAVGNSCKRMLVFASGLLVLGEVMSAWQLAGAAVALGGVMAYNVAGV